ncbi:MAG: contact-dependent growth inhibition system immunity protein [Sphingomicrobium sp.]
MLREHQERWPALCQFLGGYLHQDWPDVYGKPHLAIAAAVAEYPLSNRQQVAREWWNWNQSAGAVDDVRKQAYSLGVCVSFNTPIDARHFMNSVYDRLVESIRIEVGRDWKP